MAKTARTIADELRQRILAGELAPGARLPGEPALVKQHGVAKETARRALMLLVSEGLAVRRKGSGTYVREARPTHASAEMRAAAQALREAGPETTGRLAGLTEPVAELLEVCAEYAEKWHEAAPTSPFQAAGLRLARAVNGTVEE